jgi:LPS-assembly lipoprotein
MYGPSGEGAGHPELAAVTIAPIADRVGQQVQNHLLDLINPQGKPAQPRYLLKVQLTESIEEIAFRKTELATRANLRLRAIVSLYSVGGGDPLLTNSRTVVSSYNILQSDYATLAAQEESRSSAAREMADEIRTTLAVYFASRDDEARRVKAAPKS